MMEDVRKKLQKYFPADVFPAEAVEQGVSVGDFLTDRTSILRYLQTALFDEKVLEIELDGRPRVYFSRLKDDLPDPVEDVVDGELVLLEPDYTPGQYLTEMTHLVILPVEPGLGNLHLRYSRKVVVRMFTSSFAVEMGSTFETLAMVRDLPVLRLNFPEIARIVRKAREYRAKVPDSLNFVVSFTTDGDDPELPAKPVDIGVKGLALTISKAQQRQIGIDSVYQLKLYLDDELLARLNGTVRHVSRVRKKSEIEYVCGFEFDLQTKTIAAVIESIVARVQRAHLKELAEKSDATGIDLIA